MAATGSTRDDRTGSADPERPARYLLCVTGPPVDDLLPRVVTLLRRRRAAVAAMTMRDTQGRRELEITVAVPPARVETLCRHLQAIVVVEDAVAWRCG